ETTVITVNGFQPGNVPGDSLTLITAGAQVTSFTSSPDGQGPASKSGSFSLAHPPTGEVTRIAGGGQGNISAISVQTSPTTFQLVAAVNFNNQQLQGGIPVPNILSVPFVLAPSLVNPLQPQFGAPQVALGDVNGDGLADLIVAFGPNNAPLVTVIDGNAVVRAANGGAPVSTADFLGQFLAFESTFPGRRVVSAARRQL